MNLPLRDLTFDHVVPRSKGGKNSYDNLVLACVTCNAKKADTLVDKGKYVPNRMPYTPSYYEISQKGYQYIPREIQSVFSNWLPQIESKLSDEFIDMQGWDSDSYWRAELFE